MANTVEIVVNGKDQATQALEGIQNALQGFGNTLKTLGIVAAVGAVVKGAFDTMSSAARAFGEEEQGIKRLQAAVVASGGSWDTASVAIENYLAVQARRVSLDDGEGRDALAQLTMMTGSYEKALALMGVTIDLAAAKGMGLASASMLVGRVAQGNTEMLRRYGIVLKENSTTEEAMAELQQRFAGQGEALANTQVGQWKRLQIAIGNLNETAGAAPGLQRLYTLLAELAEKALPYVAAAAEAAAAAFTWLFQAISGAFSWGMGVIGQITGGLGGAGSQVQDLMQATDQMAENGVKGERRRALEREQIGRAEVVHRTRLQWLLEANAKMANAAADASKKQAEQEAKAAAEKAAQEAKRIHDLKLEIELAQATSSGRIDILKRELGEQKEGTVEYYEALLKVVQAEEALKKAGGGAGKGALDLGQMLKIELPKIEIPKINWEDIIPGPGLAPIPGLKTKLQAFGAAIGDAILEGLQWAPGAIIRSMGDLADKLYAWVHTPGAKADLGRIGERIGEKIAAGLLSFWMPTFLDLVTPEMATQLGISIAKLVDSFNTIGAGIAEGILKGMGDRLLFAFPDLMKGIIEKWKSMFLSGTGPAQSGPVTMGPQANPQMVNPGALGNITVIVQGGANRAEAYGGAYQGVTAALRARRGYA
jgi:hypothetical protein